MQRGGLFVEIVCSIIGGHMVLLVGPFSIELLFNNLLSWIETMSFEP